MLKGLKLPKKVPGRAGWELRLVAQGGLAILGKIEAVGYRTLDVRPTVGPRRCAPPAVAQPDDVMPSETIHA